MDFSTFAQDGFDSKKWINDSIKASKSDNTESFVLSMITKLQLLTQEVNSSFEDTSSQTLVRMPRALMEIERMAKESRSLRQNLNNILQGEVVEAQELTKQCVERMSMLHGVKKKLDHCQQTLQQVVYLQQSLKRAPTVFEQGDTTEIGSEIAKMQEAIDILKDYPEQYNIFSPQVKQFESKLVNLIEADCLTALVKHQVSVAQDHLNTLQKIGKEESVVKQFLCQSISRILSVWSTGPIQTTEFSKWLPLFFSEIRDFINTEKPYYLEVFGADQYPLRITNLVTCIIQSLQPTFISRLQSLALPELVKSYTATSQLYQYCCAEIQDKVPNDETVFKKYKRTLEESIYQPYLTLQRKYESLEKNYLKEYIRQFAWIQKVSDPSSIPNLSPAMVVSISESSSQLLVMAEEALNRCIEFTEGVESQGLLAALNEVIVEFTDMVVKLVKKQSNEGLNAKATPGTADTSVVKVGLHLHQVCSSILTKLEAFEVIARNVIVSKKPLVLSKDHQLLLLTTEPNNKKAAILAQFYDSLDTLKIPLFSLCSKHIQLLSKDVETMVFNALFETIKSWLNNISKKEVWNQNTKETVEYPLDYIRSIGDYLFDLPMIILSQAPTNINNNNTNPSEANTEEGSQQSRFWVDIVVRGAVDLFLQSLDQIPWLSQHGCEQLVCDIEYFKNVLAVLSDSTYPVLSDLPKLLQCDLNDYAAVMSSVECIEKAPLYRSIRLKREGPKKSSPRKDESSPPSSPSKPTPGPGSFQVLSISNTKSD